MPNVSKFPPQLRVIQGARGEITTAPLDYVSDDGLTHVSWGTTAFYPEELQAEPPARSTFDKVSDALGSRDCLLIYFGFIGGTFFTLGMAIVWSVL